MKKIRLIKDLPWAKAGEEFFVTENRTATPHITIDSEPYGTTLTLSELTGWYEVVRWKPSIGQPYNYVNRSGWLGYAIWADTDDDFARHGLGNCDQDNVGGKDRINAKAEQVRAIFKEGI